MEEKSQKIEGRSSQLNKLVKKFRVDWLGWTVFVAAVGIVGGFFLNRKDGTLFEVGVRESQSQGISDQVFYLYNVQFGDSTPQKTYEEARQALLNNDLEGVLATIHPDYLRKYEEGLRKAAQEGVFYEAAGRMTPLTKKIYDDGQGTVVYEMEPIPGNDSPNPLEGYSEAVEFIRDKKGVWKISSI